MLANLIVHCDVDWRIRTNVVLLLKWRIMQITKDCCSRQATQVPKHGLIPVILVSNETSNNRFPYPCNLATNLRSAITLWQMFLWNGDTFSSSWPRVWKQICFSLIRYDGSIPPNNEYSPSKLQNVQGPSAHIRIYSTSKPDKQLPQVLPAELV